MVEVLTNVYTSQAEVESIYSVAGFDFTTDDRTGAPLTQTILEFVEDATDQINQYAGLRYLETDMVNSRWVRSRASWIAAYRFAQRRGNPAAASLADRFEEIMQELRDVRSEDIDIPRLGTSGNFIPSISNYKIDDRFRERKVRVQTNISSGGIYSEQDVARFFGSQSEFF